MLAIVPATFNSIPKPNCYYNFTEIVVPYKSQQILLDVPVLKIFDAKLPVHLLCMQCKQHKVFKCIEFWPLSDTVQIGHLVTISCYVGERDKHKSWQCYFAKKNWHIGEMKLLSNIDDSLNLSAVSEVTLDLNSDQNHTQWTQPNSYSSTPCKIHSNSWPIPKPSVLMGSNIQTHT